MMSGSTRQRLVLRAAFVLLALFVGAACGDDCGESTTPAARRLAYLRFWQQQAAPKTVTPGPASTPPIVAATATQPPANLRYATVEHVTALFDQPRFTTTYTLKLVGALPQGIMVEWSGPNCGVVARQATHVEGLQREDRTVTNVTFEWQHPHPPCANTTDHSDVTVVARVTEGGGNAPRLVTICTYPGSESGTGPACQLTR